MKGILYMFLIPLLVSCQPENVKSEAGNLDIQVTIGPFCPVEPCNKNEEEFRKLYEAHKIVLTEAASLKITKYKLLYNGQKGQLKLLNLNTGNYQLDLEPTDIFTSRGLPKSLKIIKNQTTIIELDIDTGIR